MKQKVANIYKKAKASRRNKTREKLRKLTLLLAFPSEAVVSAYVSPAMESVERFSWAVLNLVGVMDFAMDRFGWDDCQVEKLLKSVMRALEKKYFFSWRVKLANKGMVSTYKRVEEAIRKVTV